MNETTPHLWANTTVTIDTMYEGYCLCLLHKTLYSSIGATRNQCAQHKSWVQKEVIQLSFQVCNLCKSVHPTLLARQLNDFVT